MEVCTNYRYMRRKLFQKSDKERHDENVKYDSQADVKKVKAKKVPVVKGLKKGAKDSKIEEEKTHEEEERIKKQKAEDERKALEDLRK